MVFLYLRGKDFLGNKLKAFYKSDPIPEHNDGNVKIAVGNNFDDIVLNESKDVLLEVYALIAKLLSPYVDSLIIAKMDGSTNEHSKAKPVDVDRTVVAFYKFLKKHVSISFKLQKPTYTDAKESSKDSNIDKKR